MEEFVKRCLVHVFNIEARSGVTAMMSAVQNGHGDIVALLLQTVSAS